MNGRFFITLLLAVCGLFLTSCQSGFISGRSLGLRDYPDAVVHIGQVDPAYRAHFAAQHGSSFSLSEQRRAFSAARQTARTPVTESGYRPAVSRRKVTRGRRVATRRGSIGRGRKAVRGRSSARGRRASASRRRAVRGRRRR